MSPPLTGHSGSRRPGEAEHPRVRGHDLRRSRPRPRRRRRSRWRRVRRISVPTRDSADDLPPAVLDEPARPPACPADRHGAPPDRRSTASTPRTPPPGGAGTAAGVSTRIRGATPNLTPGAQASRRRPAMPHGAARARLQRHDQHRHRRGHAARPHDPLAERRTGGHRPGPRGKRSRPAATPGTRGTSPAPGLLRAASHAPWRCGGPGRGGRTRACT